MADDIRFVFCGLDSYDDFSLIVNNISRNVAPAITENVQTVPGMYGSIFQGNSYGERQFDIDCTIIANSEQDRADKIHYLTDILVQTGSGEFPMVFTDDPLYTYYGHFTALPAPARVSQMDNSATVKLTFMCSDPRGYGLQEETQIMDSPFTIVPKGSGKANPIFNVILHQDVTHISLTDAKGNYVYIGNDVDPDTQTSPVDNEPRVVNDECNSFGNGWSTVPVTPSFPIENGVISSDASMQSTADAFMIGNDSEHHADFGTPPDPSNKWHGAAVQKYFPSSYDDWRIRARLFNTQHNARAMGKIEVYLLNSNGDRIGRMYLKDNNLGKDVTALAEIGTHHDAHVLYMGEGSVRNDRSKTVTIRVKNGTKTVTSHGKKKTVQQYRTVNLREDLTTSTFTDFYGYIQMQKIGNTFSCEIMKLDQHVNPVWSKPITATYTDRTGHFVDSLAGVALYCSKFDNYQDDIGIKYENNHMGLTNLKVWNILNGGNQSAVHPIGRAGDEFIINSETGEVYKDGSIFMNELYIGSNFPKIQGGVPNTLAMYPQPNNGADWFLTYRPVEK